MSKLKIFFRQNSHTPVFKALAGFGRSLNRHYENRNHDTRSNGEIIIIKKIQSLNPQILVDGGANIGKYSQLLRQHSTAEIHSFEPVADTFRILQKNLEGKAGFHLHQAGLYKENCSREINLFKSNTHSSIYDIQGLNYQSTSKAHIQLITGDEFMKNENIEKIDFLKLDLEGAEYDALDGFRDALSRQAITAIQFEYGYINITTKKLLLDYYQFFEQYGYQIGKIFPKTVEFRRYDFKYEDFLGPNFIAVRKSDLKLIHLLERK